MREIAETKQKEKKESKREKLRKRAIQEEKYGQTINILHALKRL